jgi:hypothetical protein
MPPAVLGSEKLVNAADLPEDEDEDLTAQLPDFDLADVDQLF